MKRSTQYVILNCILLLLLVSLLSTGLLLHYRLPPGIGRHSAIWGLSRHEWGEVHFWIGLSFGGMALIHVLLHWPWIRSLFVNVSERRRNAIIGAIVFAIVIFVVFVVFVLPVEIDTSGGFGSGYRGGRAAID